MLGRYSSLSDILFFFKVFLKKSFKILKQKGVKPIALKEKKLKKYKSPPENSRLPDIL